MSDILIKKSRKKIKNYDILAKNDNITNETNNTEEITDEITNNSLSEKSDLDTSKTSKSSGTIISISDFTTWEELHYNSILKFYDTCKVEDIQLMMDIVNTNKPISLRTIERFITKYCDMKGIVINVNNQYIKNEKVNVTICYNSYMDTYGKTLFDSCRRKRKFLFKSSQTGQEFITTIGQLIFFKCCFSYDFIIHTRNNINNMIADKKKIDNFYKKKKYSKKNKLIEVVKNNNVVIVDEISCNSKYKKIISTF